MRNRQLQIMTLVLLLLTAVAAKANPVDMRQARQVGAKFVSANTAMRMATESDLQWVVTYRTAGNDAAFHVFNTPKGFVIVSADDCARPILGYSEEGLFAADNVPPQMEDYLQGFVEQIQYGIDNHLVADESIAREWELVQATGLLSEQRGTTAVQPLLTDTWNQNCYYNNMCPTDASGPCGHVYAGCVATSFAQIMHYWGYPTNGTGSHTYTPSGYSQQTANFGATTYQWSNMPNNLTSSSSSTQINAVATLMWHCGVAVEMMYGPNGSGAYSEDVGPALVNYFGYSNELTGIYRSNYSDAQWLNLVKGSLDLGRPVHYSGNDGTGQSGHAFVCDGYDSNDYLHFNWGWSGYYNNYFALGALTPGNYNFSVGNYAIINIHPNCTPGTTYQVTVTASPTNGGTVTGGGTYGCGNDCTLTATPANGYMFCSWTENGVVVSAEPTYSFTVLGARNLVANFYQNSGDACTLVYTLNDSYGDGWNGNALTVSYSTGCNTYEELTIESGSSATFTRNVPNGTHVVLGWITGNWTGECSFTVTYEDGTVIYEGSNLGSSFSYEFDVDCNGASPTNYTISATAHPTAGGIVSGAGSYDAGEVCTLTATANEDYSFVNWTKDGVPVSTNETYSFTVNESGDYVANFEYTGEPPTFSMLIDEHFDGSSWPAGWYISDLGTSNWSVSATNNASGAANEMKLNWSPQFNGISRLVTPAVNLTGVSSVGFTFKHALNNYSGTNTIGIATSSDNGTTWHDAWSQGYSTSSSWLVNEVVSTSDMGQPSVRFCIYFTGNSYNINDWYFDDIQIFTLTNLNLGMTAINVPDYVAAGAQTISFDVFNYGVTTVTSLQATYELDGESVTQNFSVNIPPMGSTTLSFNTPANMIPGNYELTVSLNAVNGTTDDNSIDDSLTKTVSVALGVVERIPMIEHFSSSTCGPCVNVNTIMQNFCNNNPGRFTYTKYQMNWPGNGDPYYTQEGGTRRMYYGVNAVPNLILDGKDYATSMSQNAFDEEADKPALMDIRGSFSVSGNTINVKADVMPYVDADARVYISVNEKVTTGNVGSNGETEFHHIFMKMLPDAQGTAVSLTASTLQHLEYSCNMSSTHVEEMDDLEVAIWVQNYSNREVFNSRFAYEYTNLHPYPVQNLSMTGAGGVFVATWSAPSQGNPTGYRVYVNGQVAVENTTALSYSFNGTGDYYTVGVQALYGNGMSSVTMFEGCSNEPGNSYVIQAIASPSDAGVIVGAGTFVEGQTCTLTATANVGYAFVNWTKDNEVVSTNSTYSFTVTEDATFVAQFASTTHHWTYNPYLFSDNMNVLGMVAVNGQLLQSTFIEVGAFCGDECRGSDFVMEVDGQYLALMTIGGENGDVITFRAYDHLSGQEIEGTCTFSVPFEINGLIGMPPADPVVLDFVNSAQITQTTEFVQGWTWWSPYVETSATNVLDQLKEGLGGSGQIIKSQSAATTHLPTGTWVGSLNMNNEQGYMVKATAEVTVDITGPAASPEDHTITLNPGWTWIGYPCANPMSVSEALANLTPQAGDVLKGQQATAMFMSGQWRGALSTLTPGIGLMYKSNSSSTKTLVYSSPSRMTEVEPATETYWKADYTAYPTNMTVLAIVELDDVELNSGNYELAAFAGDECRGSVQLMYVEPLDRHFALLTIAGDEASELRFSLFDTETGAVETQSIASLQYEADAVVGSPDVPYIVRFRSTTGVDEWASSLQLYPNPVEHGQTVSLGLSAEDMGEVKVEIVNALGAVVETQNFASVRGITPPRTAGVYTLRITVEGKGTCYRKLVVR